jgi:hypothetical protein
MIRALQELWKLLLIAEYQSGIFRFAHLLAVAPVFDCSVVTNSGGEGNCDIEEKTVCFGNNL